VNKLGQLLYDEVTMDFSHQSLLIWLVRHKYEFIPVLSMIYHNISGLGRILEYQIEPFESNMSRIIKRSIY